MASANKLQTIYSADTSLRDAWQKCRVQIAGLD